MKTAIKSKHRRSSGVGLLAAALLAGAVQAQGLYQWESYDKRVSSAQTIEALGSEMFGDSVSLQNGALSFSVTDVDLPGNNTLAVSFTRSYTVENSREESHNHLLGDWSVALPRISGRFVTDWLAAGYSSNRCSSQTAPSIPSDLIGIFEPSSFWQGISLDIPGVGGGELLVTEPGVTKAVIDGQTAHWTTNGQLQVGCLPSISNGSGEGFVAITPDGTKYYFNWMARREVADVLIPRTDTGGANVGHHRLPVVENSLYATRVVDRFGNEVNYTYTNAWNQPVRLTRISASDQRQLDVAYGSNGLVSSVTARRPDTTVGARTWNYGYGLDAAPVPQTILASVGLPDGRSWQIQFANLSFAPIVYPTGKGLERSCIFLATPENYNLQPTGTIVHPSGARATFRLGIREHGRSNVTLACSGVTSTASGNTNDPNDDVNLFPISFESWTLLDKRIEGAGVPAQVWSYDYEFDFSYHLYPGTTPEFPVCIGAHCHQPICTSDACAGTSRTLITRPDGSRERYFFGNSWQYNEGKLLKIERQDHLGQVLESTVNSYDFTRTNTVYPARFGTSLRINADGFDSMYHRPQWSASTHRDGATFGWTVLGCGTQPCMDALARTLRQTQSSSLGFSKQESYSYLDHAGKWVLGQLAETRLDGVLTARAEYDPSSAQMLRLYLHGNTSPDQSLSYNADGTVASVTDGRGLSTSLGNWYRGIPQLIGYPDGSSESAVVNLNGWVTSTTDELYRTTSYGHDAMGRLTLITPPANGSTPWAPTTLSFDLLTNPGFGLAAGHWRQTLSRGGYQQHTYFDALWRPVLVHQSGSGLNRYSVKGFDQLNRENFSAYPRETLNSVAEAGTGVRRSFDALGRMRTETSDSELGALTTRIDYFSGFRKQITNPRGKLTTLSFQAFAEPSEDAPVRIDAPAGQITEITRDAYGKPTRIARSTVVNSQSLTVDRRYVYDSKQRLCKRIEPESGAHLFDYDGADNLAWSAHGLALTGSSCDRTSVPKAERIGRAYDPRNRLTAIDYPDATADIGYSYYADGALLSASRHGSTWSYSYNSLGLPTLEALSHAGQNRSFAYAYDALGGLQSTTYPDGEVLSYNPNALGLATQVGGYASALQYHANGVPRQALLGNGLLHQRSLNARQLPTRLSYSLGATPQVDLDYRFDSNANVASISDLRPGGLDSQSFGYDDLDRLVSASAPGSYQSALYEYDAFDNLRRSTLSSRDLRYQYDANNRLSAITQGGSTVISYGYDSRGNAIQGGPTQVVFDRADTVTAVVGQESYKYDAHGHRIEVVTGSSTRYPVYTRDGLLRAEYGNDQNDQYYYHGTQLIARKRTTQRADLVFSSGFEALVQNIVQAFAKHFTPAKNGTSTITWFLSDHLGSNVATADASGQILERSQFSPFGERFAESVERGPGYAGHYEDSTSLTYMKARYYGGIVGRFISIDPVGVDPSNGGNFNRYWYGNNNPQKFVDPDGRAATAFVLGAFEADVAIPEPTDAAWPKWVGWGVAIGGAALIDYAIYNENAEEGDLSNGDTGGETEGKPFDRKTKGKIADANAEVHGGLPTCEECLVQLDEPEKSTKGVTPSPDEAQVDHLHPQSKGGNATEKNGRMVCRTCNRNDSDKVRPKVKYVKRTT